MDAPITDTPITDDSLHLPSLSVRGLLGIPDLTIPRLGRVTLIAGKNGVGKTTLLDAIRIYAAKGNYLVLDAVLQSRDEIVSFDETADRKTPIPDLESLFYGRCLSSDSAIAIGPASGEQELVITAMPGMWDDTETDRIDDENDDPPLLGIAFDGTDLDPIRASVLASDVTDNPLLRRRLRRNLESSALFPYRSLGPNAPGNDDITQLWDTVALTPDEDWAVAAFRPIYGDAIQRVAAIADPRGPRLRRLMVSRKDQPGRVPLRSLGEGAVRMFGVALALANSSGGVLLIDEVENGIHYSVQGDFWKMVFQAAQDNDVQVIAATHSRDCIKGFRQAALALEVGYCAVVRLTRRHGKLFTTTFDGPGLDIVLRQDFEVR